MYLINEYKQTICMISKTNKLFVENYYSLITATKSLPIAGKIFLIACGKTISLIIIAFDIPKLLAASVCPLSNPSIPALMISATKAAEFKAVATIAAVNASISTLNINFVPDYTISICRSIGVPLTTSTKQCWGWT